MIALVVLASGQYLWYGTPRIKSPVSVFLDSLVCRFEPERRDPAGLRSHRLGGGLFFLVQFKRSPKRHINAPFQFRVLLRFPSGPVRPFACLCIDLTTAALCRREGGEGAGGILSTGERKCRRRGWIGFTDTPYDRPIAQLGARGGLGSGEGSMGGRVRRGGCEFGLTAGGCGMELGGRYGV